MPFSPESLSRRTENILASISDCFFALDTEWRFVYLNPRALEFFGRSQRELLGETIWDATPELRGGTTERELRRVRENGGRSNFLARRPDDGRWIEHTIYARDGDAEVPEAGGGLSVYFRDVSQAQQNEQAKRERNEFYRLLVENAREYGIISFDLQGRITHWNKGAGRIFGWDENEVRGECGGLIFTPEDRAGGAPEQEMETAQSEGRANDERWHLKKDGSLFFAEGAMMALGWDEGNVRGYVKILRDNTEKRAAQEAVRQNEERLKQVSDATGVALWAWEPHRDILHYQHALDKLYGLPVVSFSALTPNLHPDDVGMLGDQLMGAVEEGRSLEMVFRLSPQPDALPWRWYETKISVSQTDDGQPLLLGVNQDITARREAELALKRSQSNLQNVMRETGVGLWSWNAQTDELLEALNLEDVTGVDPFSMDGLRDAIHPDDAPRIFKAVEDAMKAGEGYEFEHRVKQVPDADPARETDWKWVAAKASASASAQGETVFSGFISDISARRRADVALQQSRERLENVAREVNVALWQWDPAQDFVQEHVNLDEIFEMPGEAVSFGNIVTMTHLADRDFVIETVQGAVEKRAPYDVEFRLQRRGTVGDPQNAAYWKWILVIGRPTEEEPLVYSGFAFDISARKEAELQRRASEERFAALVGASATIVWRSLPSGELIESSNWNDYTGQTPEESAGWGYLDAIYEGDRERVAREWNDAISRNARLAEMRYRVRHRSGQMRHVASRAVPILDANGNTLEWLGTLDDVHDEIEAQNAVRESEARYSALVRASATIVWLGSPDLARMQAAGWADFTGQGNEKVDGFSWMGAVHPDDRERVASEWQDLLDAPRTTEIRHRLRDSTGRFRHVLVRAVPIFERARDSATGTSNVATGTSALAENLPVRPPILREWVGTITDVHERTIADELRELFIEEEQRARQIAEDARLEAERANRMKDDFLAVVSHELRTPLNAILGWTNLLQSGELPPETAREGLAVIERNARAQAQIVEDILDVARVVTGKLKVETRPLDVENVAREAIEATQNAATVRGVVLVSELASLPVEGDGVRLRQVMWNLLSNAIKFSPSGGRVTLNLSRQGNKARIEVRDEGAGIAPEFLPHVFERFRQADSSSTRRHGGLGLGLALVRSIIEAHGGHVEARSEGIGHGATFAVELPLSLSACQVVVEPAIKEGGRLAGVHILVCDDASDTLEFTALLLQREGAHVFKASSASHAQNALENSPFDVLLSDLAMPERDGYELLDWTRAHCPDLPVIAMTAYAGTIESERARNAGFAAFIAKPMEANALVETIAALVGRGK